MFIENQYLQPCKKLRVGIVSNFQISSSRIKLLYKKKKKK